MKIFTKKINISNGARIYYLSLWTILIAPSVVLADRGWNPGDPIVPCDNNCNFNDLIQLIDNLLMFFIWIAVPISILVFAYIGWLYMTSGDNSGQRTKAKDSFFALIKGLFLVLAAWLIVKAIVSGLGGKDWINLLGN